MPRRVLVALCCALALTSCRLDVTVELVVGADGTGDLTVTAVADAEVVAPAPGLADDLRFDDAAAAGWQVEGPGTTDDDGLTVTLRHPIGSAQEATNLLASLGPPFTDMALSRAAVGDTTTNELTGHLTLPGGGFDAFADADLLAAVGGTPFADELATTGATPAGSMSVTFRSDLPGDVEATTGGTRDGVREWAAPLDGGSLNVTEQTVQRPPTGGAWAGPLATVALVLLVAWVLVSVAAIALVVRARRRRATQRRRTVTL